MARAGDNSRPGKMPAFDREPFRRAITGCMRAIAGEAELDVSFGNERPGLSGAKARLPDLPKRPDASDIAVTRGLADAMALRRAVSVADLDVVARQRQHLPVLQRGDLGHEAQPQPAAAAAAGRPRQRVEALGQARQMLGRDAVALVDHLHPNHLLAALMIEAAGGLVSTEARGQIEAAAADSRE